MINNPKPIIDYVYLAYYFQLNPPKKIYKMLKQIERRNKIRIETNKDSKEIITHGITKGEKEMLINFRDGKLKPSTYGTKNEGLNLVSKKKYPDKIEGNYPDGDGRLTQYWNNGNKKFRYRTFDDGYWAKYEYDENGNEIYFEDSDGYWSKSEYDENGNEIYYETSNGFLRDNRPQNINEGLNLVLKPKILKDRYFYLRYCPYGWAGDECHGSADFKYFKIPGYVFSDIDFLKRPHNDETLYDILRAAINNDIIEKYYIDLADEIIELEEEEYNKLTTDDLFEGLNLVSKKKYQDKIEGDYPDGYGLLTQYWDNGNRKFTHRTYSNGTWWKSTYDENGNPIYYKDSDGYWAKHEYDENGNVKYFENSRGVIKDNRPQNLESEIDEGTDISSVGSGGHGNGFAYIDPYGKGQKTRGTWAKNESSMYHNKKPYWPGGSFVTVKKKCQKFPYCNQGDTGALNFSPNKPKHKKFVNEGLNLVSKKKYREEIVGNYPGGNGQLTQYWDNGNVKFEHRTFDDGSWSKSTYDENENLIRYEESTGYWAKFEYDKNEHEIYYENSDGIIRDYRPQNVNEGLNLVLKPRNPYDYISDPLSTLTKSNSNVIQQFFNQRINLNIKNWGTKNLRIQRYNSGWALINYNAYLAWRDLSGNFYINKNKYSASTNKIQSYIFRFAKLVTRADVKYVNEDELYRAANKYNPRSFSPYGTRIMEERKIFIKKTLRATS